MLAIPVAMIDPPPRYSQPPANDAGGSPDDVREQLRADHDRALAALDALRREQDPQRCTTGLRELRTAWVVHALAEETVVYRTLEGHTDAGARADERFIEHELVGGLFDKLLAARPGTLEWNARLNVIRDLISRHIESEYRVLFPQLTREYDDEALREMGERFRLAHEKLLMLERAKAA
jgi:hemerythrin superfamily protein